MPLVLHISEDSLWCWLRALSCCSSCQDGPSRSSLGTCISVSSPGDFTALPMRRPGLNSVFCPTYFQGSSCQSQTQAMRIFFAAARKVPKGSPSPLRNQSSQTPLSSPESLGEAHRRPNPGPAAHCWVTDESGAMRLISAISSCFPQLAGSQGGTQSPHRLLSLSRAARRAEATRQACCGRQSSGWALVPRRTGPPSAHVLTCGTQTGPVTLFLPFLVPLSFCSFVYSHSG